MTFIFFDGSDDGFAEVNFSRTIRDVTLELRDIDNGCCCSICRRTSTVHPRKCAALDATDTALWYDATGRKLNWMHRVTCYNRAWKKPRAKRGHTSNNHRITKTRDRYRLHKQISLERRCAGVDTDKGDA